MRDPRVSILLPCRNADAYLSDAIASLEEQTFGDFEVIAVDDGSTDDTANILNAWATRDGRVRVSHMPPRGIVRALQVAAGASRAPLLARMDADDIASPDRLKRQIAYLDARPDVVACGTRIRYIPRSAVKDGARRYELWINSLSEPALLERDLFVECPIAHPTLLVRRAAFERAGGYRETAWPEDYDLVFRLWRAGGRLANVPEVLLDWRESQTRLSRTDARYTEDALRRCKVHHLAASLLDGVDRVIVWGAGPVGKAFARMVAETGRRMAAFVDVDPRKIGQTVYAAPVIAPAGLNAFRGVFVLAAVSGAGPRAEIRAALDAADWREMRDYCAVA
ncbi:MAG: glycosyltransferase [Longimicrobiales bacterium]